MKAQKLAAINDLTSPLFRIMSVHNDNEPLRRQVDNNVCAFHIGNGYILSVAHALMSELTIFRSISEDRFQADIVPQLSAEEVIQFNQRFLVDNVTNKRYLRNSTQVEIQQIVDALRRINYDTRISSLYQNQICKPYLIIQQRAAQFYNNANTHGNFNPANTFVDPGSQRQTYFIELELVESLTENDVALYRIVNTHQSIIELIPNFEIDPEIYDVSNNDFYCLQTAPSDLTPGRLINEANIEGLVDQWITQSDRIGGGYVFQG